jgi:hypothetical protein
MNEQKQLSEMSELELKAAGYEQICVLEQIKNNFDQVKNNLVLISQEIDKRIKKDA